MSDDEESSGYVGEADDLEFEMSDGTTFNFDTYNDCDWEYDYDWEESGFNSDGSSGTLSGFTYPTVNVDIDMEILYWDRECFLLKMMITSGEPFFSAQRLNDGEFKEIDIEDLPKEGKDALAKEMI